MIRSIVSESSKINGILFFSTSQISEDLYLFEKIILNLIKKKKIVIFVLENEIIRNKKELNSLITNLKIKKSIKKTKL